jgi:DNA-binding HxlR family transcriptional regulator
MALPREYEGEICPLARSLEVIGERWTLLIIRDAFYGVRRFNDFRTHLKIPPAVLAVRLRLLVEHGIMATSVGDSGRDEYDLTANGESLWPAVWSLMRWGKQYLEKACQPSFTHYSCGGTITSSGVCEKCGRTPEPGDLVRHPPRGKASAQHGDRISGLLGHPHQLLQPLTESG